MNKNVLRKINRGFEFSVLTLPAFLSVVLITVIPFIMNAYYAWFKWDGVSKNKEFIGFKNFVDIFTIETSFKDSLMFTFKFTVLYVVIINLIAITIASALSNNTKIAYVFRSFYFIPHIISLVAISLVWKCILGPGFNTLYEATGFKLFGLSWLGEANLALITVVFVAIWQNVGFYMVVYIAGFTAIPTDILEAASVDGATPLQKFLRIKIPLLMPSITIAIFTSLTYSFKLFDIILVLTKGGPGGSTSTIAYNIYNDAFASSRYGMATAKSLVFFLIVMVITAIQLKYFKSKEVRY